MSTLRIVRSDEQRSLSTTERSAIIRAELKKRGITSRQVSVRTDNYSMGSSIRIIIRDLKVKKPEVEEIAQHHESYRRDESGDILSGGNRFVFVEYDRDTIRNAAAPVLHFLTDAFSQDAGGHVALEHGYTVDVVTNGSGGRYSLWLIPPGEHAGSHVAGAWDLESAAITYIDKLCQRGLF